MAAVYTLIQVRRFQAMTDGSVVVHHSIVLDQPCERVAVAV